MTDNELDQLMQRVLLDAIKRDCEKENSVVPSFEPSLRYQRSLAAMIADPLKWAHKRAKPLWKNILQKVAVVLIIFSLSLGSLMVVSPNIRAAVVNWVTEWYETHITYRYLGTPTDNEMPKYNIFQAAVFRFENWNTGGVLKSPFFEDTAVSGRYRRVHFTIP